MGDQIGTAVEGTLYFIPENEFERLRGLNIDTVTRTGLFADACRLNTLYMIAKAGSGHIGSSFSAMDIVSWLYLNEMNDGDVYYSSKGHDSPGLYSVLIALGRLPPDKLHQLRRLGGLPGHPDVQTPGMVINSGSLGMGISKAKGMINARRLKDEGGRIFVLTGDGELQEGQIWESLAGAANRKMGELTVIVDHNKYQSDHRTEMTSNLGDLEAKFAAFGWHVERLDGHDLGALQSGLARLATITDKPKVIIADTIKGRGISFMEHTTLISPEDIYRYHSGAPSPADYRKGTQELIERVNGKLIDAGFPALELESASNTAPPSSPEGRIEKLIPAYSEALIKAAEHDKNIVALDGDLILDTGLIPFRDHFPERFIECGIAEQDMVSQAGGLALEGMLPVVHSFACFLTTRPNEQIYNNATERTKVVYVGSLAGILPSGPGHSHQSVRDISALGAIPGLVLAQPCCVAEVAPLVQYALRDTADSVYLRLESVPVEVPFDLPADYRPQVGRGVALTEGKDVVLFAYGAVMCALAVKTAHMLSTRHGLGVRVIALPWLNRLDGDWLEKTIDGARAIITLDNHYVANGQGAMIGAVLAERAITAARLTRIGIDDVPRCGTSDEVLTAHQLDAESLAERIHAVVPEKPGRPPL